jgi:hypothetical protein
MCAGQAFLYVIVRTDSDAIVIGEVLSAQRPKAANGLARKVRVAQLFWSSPRISVHSALIDAARII